jgi:urease accessory protein
MALAVPNVGRDDAGQQPGRDVGRGRVVASRLQSGATRPTTTALTTLRAGAPLKLLTPSFPAAPKCAAVCLVTFGGGLVDGDRIEVEIVVERDATLLVFTQSSTKVFRGQSAQHISARVEDGGALILLPDPVSAFAGARYTQRIDIALAGTGSCVVLDGFTSGRAAFGERWLMNALDLKTTIRRDSSVLVADALRIEEDASELQALHAFDAFATLLAVGERARPVLRAMLHDPISPPNANLDLVVAASALPRARSDSAILRVAASSPALALSSVRSRLRNLPEIDAVDPFSSRY